MITREYAKECIVRARTVLLDDKLVTLGVFQEKLPLFQRGLDMAETGSTKGVRDASREILSSLLEDFRISAVAYHLVVCEINDLLHLGDEEWEEAKPATACDELLDFLFDVLNSEDEYQEALDLVSKLVVSLKKQPYTNEKAAGLLEQAAALLRAGKKED